MCRFRRGCGLSVCTYSVQFPALGRHRRSTDRGDRSCMQPVCQSVCPFAFRSLSSAQPPPCAQQARVLCAAEPKHIAKALDRMPPNSAMPTRRCPHLIGPTLGSPLVLRRVGRFGCGATRGRLDDRAPWRRLGPTAKRLLALVAVGRMRCRRASPILTASPNAATSKPVSTFTLRNSPSPPSPP